MNVIPKQSHNGRYGTFTEGVTYDLSDTANSRIKLGFEERPDLFEKVSNHHKWEDIKHKREPEQLDAQVIEPAPEEEAPAPAPKPAPKRTAKRKPATKKATSKPVTL